MRTHGRVRRGAVLVVVMGILFVLALLATTFSTMVTLDRIVARNYLDGIRARLISRAGVDHAQARMKESLYQNPTALRPYRYYGNDIAEAGTVAALLNVPLESARNPSLAYEAVAGVPENPQNPIDANVAPKQITVDGQPVGLSGLLETGSYGLNADHFSLKITDLTGLIHINDGIGESSTYGSVTRNLARVLNRLGDVVGVPGAGTTIIASRPGTGYASKEDLVAVLGGTNYALIAPFVTAHAWVDRSVVQPVPLSGDPAVLAYYNSKLGFANPSSTGPYYRGLPARFRYGRQKNYDGAQVTLPLRFAPEAAAITSFDHAIWGHDELNPQWIEVCSRAPVNLNTAPCEVLCALLADLQGLWVAERRRNSPMANSTVNSVRAWQNTLVQTYDSSIGGIVNGDADEVGFVYSTDPIVWTGSSATGPNSAAAIASEIIACRQSQVSAISGYNYDRGTNPAAWFGGPFKTWRQFHGFCDNLVALGLVRETRSIFHVYPAPGSGPAGGGPMTLTNAADATVHGIEALAAQAIADAIKANFNPNLHLNELNPDENRALLVDKTDLIVLSTEGCLTPMGFFEIESVGRVVRPNNYPPDALTATNNELVAHAKCAAVVKLFDARRFTSQKDFYAGDITPRDPALVYETNNGLSLETGPVPDNGTAPQDADWAGYVGFATRGGSEYATSPGGAAAPLPKPKGTVGYTPAASSSEISSLNTIHAHFTHDTRAHYHLDGEMRNLCQVAVTNENVENRPDRTETAAGPYDTTMGPDPVSGAPVNRHRMARSFRVPAAGASGSPPAVLAETAPLDLRVDGVYLERDASIGYWASTNSLSGFVFEVKMLASFWMKPNFYPEVTQKPRQLWNGSRVEMRWNLWRWYGYLTEPSMLDLWLTPSHDPNVEMSTFMGTYTNFMPSRPCSLLFAHTPSYMTEVNGAGLCYSMSVAQQTRTLNHHYHTAGGGWTPTPSHAAIAIQPSSAYYRRDNPLAAHRWMHVVVAMTSDWVSAPYTPDARIWVNGQPSYSVAVPAVRNVYDLGLGMYSSTWKMDWTLNLRDDNAYYPNLTQVPYGDKNLIRIGQPNRVTSLTWASGTAYRARHNFAPDATIDEFMHFRRWDSVTESSATAQWRAGRYHIPRATDEGRFTSAIIDLTPPTTAVRVLPPPSTAAPPLPPVAPPPAGTTGTSAFRLIGIAWTLFGETIATTQPNLDVEMINYDTVQTSGTPAALRVRTDVSVEADGTWYGTYTDDAYSTIVDPLTSAPLTVGNPASIRFRIHFKWTAPPPLTAILLASPFVDDVTIYYDAGNGGFLSFHML